MTTTTNRNWISSPWCLNGPPGASDTPENFVPASDPGKGLLSAEVIVIRAVDEAEAQEKQIIYYALMQRARELDVDGRRRLERLAREVLGDRWGSKPGTEGDA